MARIEYFIATNGKPTFMIRHLFGTTYCNTTAELNKRHTKLFEWLEENTLGEYNYSAMDNAAFSDMFEDVWVGYCLQFDNEEDALAFKLEWV